MSEDPTVLASQDLRLATAQVGSRSRLRVTIPHEGTPVLDISARFTATSARDAVGHLPLRKLKPGLVEWLDRAVVAGRVPAGGSTTR